MPNFDWDTEGLTPGMHNIRARASDTKNTFITSINVSLIDVTKPIIDIDNPLNNSVFRIGEEISFTGTASDNVGVLAIELMLDDDVANLEDITLSYKNGEWSYELQTNDLTDGEHTITLKAFDAADNNASNKIQFTLLEIINPKIVK